MRDIRGSCHCGAISFVFVRGNADAPVGARACGCSFCQKHGGVWTSDPAGSLRVAVPDPSRVSKYAFGTRTAEFWVCRVCGVVPLVTSDIDEVTYAVVSVRAFDDADTLDIRESTSDFSVEATDDRLARRQRHWIARVEFQPGLDSGPNRP